jgi:hypothetical protein
MSRFGSQKTHECLGSLMLCRMRECGDAIDDRLLQFRGQRIEDLYSRDWQELADLLHADIRIAPSDHGSNQLAGARGDPLRRDRIGNSQAFDHIGEVHAARPRAVRYRSGREQGSLQFFRRTDVWPWCTGAHRKAGAGAGESCAAAIEQCALTDERARELFWPNEQVTARAVANPVREIRSARLGDVDFMAARAFEFRHEFD